MKKLRLLMFEKCNRSCERCCNKDFSLDTLPVVQDYSGYRTIMLTGGEPMLNVPLLLGTVAAIREVNPKAKIIVYTAKINRISLVLSVLEAVDGMTVTLHKQKDKKRFFNLNMVLMHKGLLALTQGKSLRLNAFREAEVPSTYEGHGIWKVKNGLEWIKNCPLPTDEVFMRLGDL